MPELAQAADGLHPPEDLLHELPFPLTHVIARMPRGPAIDRAPAGRLEGQVALGRAGRVGGPDVGDEPVPMVQQHVAQIRQLGFLARAFPMQHRLRIGRRGVRGIAPALPTEVDGGIPGVIGGLARLRIPRLKALQAGPGLQLRWTPLSRQFSGPDKLMSSSYV